MQTKLVLKKKSPPGTASKPTTKIINLSPVRLNDESLRGYTGRGPCLPELRRSIADCPLFPSS